MSRECSCGLSHGLFLVAEAQTGLQSEPAGHHACVAAQSWIVLVRFCWCVRDGVTQVAVFSACALW